MYLAHTAHLQFVALILGFLAWILLMTSAGLNEWRLWQVEGAAAVSSGVAWVGLWRACFYSHQLPDIETCRAFSIGDAFLPPEISAGQVLMMLAALAGLGASVCGAYALRLVLFSVEDRRRVRPAFLLAGALYLLTSVLSMVPLLWTVSAVLQNRPIDFPPEFLLPAAPSSQQVGAGVAVGLLASAVLLLSALTFCGYRYARKPLRSAAFRHAGDPLDGPWAQTTLAGGTDNPAFQQDQAL